MNLVEQIRDAEKMEFVDRNGLRRKLKLTPPWSSTELTKFANLLPCKLPRDMRQFLEYCSGFETDFADSIFNEHTNRIYFQVPPRGYGEVFPDCVQIAHDHCGNSWIIDLTSKGFGPVFFCSHDPPVIAYQAETLSEFFEEVFKIGNSPWNSNVMKVWDEISNTIWDTDPNAMQWLDCTQSADALIRDFSNTLDASFLFADMRNPKLGDGFRVDTLQTPGSIKRYGEQRVYAIKKRAPNWLAKVFGAK